MGRWGTFWSWESNQLPELVMAGGIPLDESIEVYYWPFTLTLEEQEAWRMCSPRMRCHVAELEKERDDALQTGREESDGEEGRK